MKEKGRMAPRKGRTVAVCLSHRGGIPKTPCPQVTLGPYGIEGDFHSGPLRRSRRTGELKPNDRQVSIVSQEAIDALNAKLGIDIPPGGFAENFLIEGVGDLSDLESGDQFLFEGGATIEVTEQNDPCANLRVWHKMLPREARGRRGVVGIVRQGGIIRRGERFRIGKKGIRSEESGRRARRPLGPSIS